ncbi:MAG: hypothetical protein GTN76_09720 [Candidatus Aenigmarchaeota archaeon]|nr:hypothetical protein [Candidatus Aenigmarchaeota archaeon]
MSMPRKKRRDSVDVRLSIEGDLFKRLERLKQYYQIEEYTEMVRFCITDAYKKIEHRPRFEHVNTYDNHVKILDNQMNRIAEVYFKTNDKSWCSLCNSHDCVHIEYAWTLPKIAKILREHGFKSPSEKRSGYE